MKQSNNKKTGERDRQVTEKRLLDTIGEMVAEHGFEKVGINAVAAQSGVSKILIYRYFGSIEGLLAEYIRQHDFWINFPEELPQNEDLSVFFKNIFKEQINQLRKEPTLRKLYRWELSTNNEMINELRKQREKTGIRIIETVSNLISYPPEEVAVMATIVSAAISYLSMLEDSCPAYNGIPLSEDAGWQQISKGIDILIDKWFVPKI